MLEREDVSVREMWLVSEWRLVARRTCVAKWTKVRARARSLYLIDTSSSLPTFITKEWLGESTQQPQAPRISKMPYPIGLFIVSMLGAVRQRSPMNDAYSLPSDSTA